MVMDRYLEAARETEDAKKDVRNIVTFFQQELDRFVLNAEEAVFVHGDPISPHPPVVPPTVFVIERLPGWEHLAKAIARFRFHNQRATDCRRLLIESELEELGLSKSE